METIVAIAFNDFVIMAADRNENFSILKLSASTSKIYSIGSHIALATSGDPGDKIQFAEFVQRNMELEKFRDGFEVPIDKAFHWTRWQLATRIRSRNPSQCNPLIGGFDTKRNVGRVFYLDYMGTGIEVGYAIHGYGESFASSFFDRHHKPGLSKEQAIELVKGALNAIQTRIIVSQSVFQMVLIDKDGITPLPDHVINNEQCTPA